MFTFNKDVTATNCEPGVTRKILCYSDDLMMCEIHFEKGSKGNFHSHKHLQITYVAKGSFEFTIGDETKIRGTVYTCLLALHMVLHVLKKESSVMYSIL